MKRLYRLLVNVNDIIIHYDVKASNIQQATLIAKNKIMQKYFCNDVRVSLDPNDLSNHISEILENLYNV